jgi:hypothetical protein
MEMQALSTGNPSLPDSPANNPLVSKPFDFEQQPNGKKE